MSTIQWFPGHMNKAKREVSEKLKYVDIVLELVDARLPQSSRNPLLGKIIENKPRLLILNKADLADKQQTKAWLAYFKAENLPAIAINAKDESAKKKILQACEEVLKDLREKDAAKGRKPRVIRGMVLGIPNVGKSTLLNRLVGKKLAATGNKPGVTKGQQWLKVGGSLELLDTPGILWPKFEDEQIAEKLAITGAIKDQLLALDDLALATLRFLSEKYPTALISRYGFTEEILQDTPVNQLLFLTKKRGFKEDYDRGATLLLNELRQGKLGPLTFDEVEDD